MYTLRGCKEEREKRKEVQYIAWEVIVRNHMEPMAYFCTRC
jgi:hypothetical protein